MEDSRHRWISPRKGSMYTVAYWTAFGYCVRTGRASRLCAFLICVRTFPNIPSCHVEHYAVCLCTAGQGSKHCWPKLFAMISSGEAVGHKILICLHLEGSFPSGEAVFSGTPVWAVWFFCRFIDMLLVENNHSVRVQETSKSDCQLTLRVRPAKQHTAATS